MAILSFSLSPEATAKIYESLLCLAKFGESVSIEARSEKLTITALNLSRTAYASFTLDATKFFVDYNFSPVNSRVKGGDRFTCQLLNKPLQSVFKGRMNDFRGRENSIEKCEVSVLDQPDEAECRLIVKMLCKHGITKTYRLTYESVEVMHALFDRSTATQGWRISSRVLREYIEFFGPNTEQLDLVAQEGKAIFTSFTEKAQDGKEALKHPLETAIAIHTEDFEDFHVQEEMHIVISVKDFKAIVTHAETLRESITARFSYPTRPLQFSYQNFGMHCEFTLMTTGEYRGTSTTPAPKYASTRNPSRQQSMAPPPSEVSRSACEIAPPARPTIGKPVSSQSQRTSLKKRIEQPSVDGSDPDPDSLFMPAGEMDQAWDPPNYDNEEAEEMLGWDASNSNPSTGFHQTFRDSGTVGRPKASRPASVFDNEGLEPTQRLSQYRGMFD
ncbi:hypothetical protein M433DRAFT_149219 [Acidomyces richmondensis BFW]|nr:MAG: hypothetical protein FE78DRAFT_84426 [Acidomyces sp. 'richmondensis']KYG50195.1 hypothetical protein M433DRAFT_149219 [Acidomyces richmondensis BFW]